MTFRCLTALALTLISGLAVAQDAPALKTEKEKINYSLGANLANQLRAASIDVDVDVLTRGLRDALAGGKMLLNETEVRTTLLAMRRGIGAARQRAQSGDAAGAPKALANMTFAFKLDPRLVSGNYGGDPWVSPPTYTKMGDAKTCTVEARVQGRDANGATVPVTPTWTASDSEMVTIAPVQGTEITMVVKRAGESTVRVSANGVSKELTIKAAYGNDVLRVDISEKQS